MRSWRFQREPQMHSWHFKRGWRRSLRERYAEPRRSFVASRPSCASVCASFKRGHTGIARSVCNRRMPGGGGRCTLTLCPQVLWSRLAPHLSRPAAAASQRPLTIGRNKSPRSSSLPEPAAPPSGSSSARPPPVAATSPAAGIAAAAGAPLAAPAETAGPTAPAGAAGDLIRTSAPQPTQQPSGASHALDSSTAQQEASVITVFVLEEDSESQSEPVLHATEDEEPLERAAVVSLEFPAASSARHEEEPVSGGGGAGAGAALFGTSVPISIPPSRSLYSSRLSDISAPAVLPADQLDQATSFDVPLSSTRRIKGYL